ncbi:helix-turn-helix domain-containing protein [Streptomyces aureoverticillatus]|uniref:helix-turn-helix domain-containing protein n=1 Tax=Streptomyces aureoverticillatus TaxID=66871 RepID=UPI001EF788E6|nr:helix-turn-helix domain-containing protein [Streptomyces aureoverticillatus]
MWKAVLPLRGGVRVNGSVGAGVLVPPQYAHTCATSTGFVAVFLDPWRLRADRSGPTWLDARGVRRLVEALGECGAADGFGPGALCCELAALAGPPAPVDPRVLHAVRGGPGALRLTEVAAEIGLSPTRLRALVRAEVGVPLGVLRRWRRLRTAVGALVDGGGVIADAAAAAGFSDQAHLTRTARTLVGRTPASLRPPRAGRGTEAVPPAAAG